MRRLAWVLGLGLCCLWAAQAQSRDGPAIMPPQNRAGLLKASQGKRLLLVFAKDGFDPWLKAQTRMINEAETSFDQGRTGGFRERDFTIWYWTAAEARQFADMHLHEDFAVPKEDFAVILIGKDGDEAARFHEPVEAETIFALVDAMPMRQREMRQRTAQ